MQLCGGPADFTLCGSGSIRRIRYFQQPLLVSGGLWLGDMKKQVFPAVRTELSAGCGDGVLFALGFPRRSDPEGPSGSRIGLRGTGDTRVW